MSMRPTILSNESHYNKIDNLQKEIELHQKEIRLLKEKLALKDRIENMRVLKNPRKDIRWEKINFAELCDLGVKKVQRDYGLREDQCSIF